MTPPDQNDHVVRNELPSFDDPSVMSKVMQYHADLMGLAFLYIETSILVDPNL